MSDKVYEQKCPACDAMMRFDPASGTLVCDYCGTTLEVEAEEPKAEKIGKKGKVREIPDSLEGFDFNALLNQKTTAEPEDLPVYNCVSCGAEVIAPPEQMALTCPYCRNNIVLTSKTTGKLRPDGVIPFEITADQLPKKMKEFYKDKKLLPPDFFSVSRMQNITGIYVPFWVFSGNADGDLSFTGDTVSVAIHGDVEYTTTSTYVLNSRATLGFENLPVDASERIDDDRMGALEPFDMRRSKPFNMGYLAGFTADRFDEAADKMAERAKDRMALTCKTVGASYVRQNSTYLNIVPKGGSISISNLDAKYVLFPVYMFDLTYGDKKFPFAVNGQTGKVVGEVPTSKSVSRGYFLLRFLGTAVGIVLLFVIKYMLGW